MKAVHWIILGLVIAMATWFIYQTNELESRVDTYIDLNWRFILDDPNGASQPGYNDSDWGYLSLPHDWMIEQKAEVTNPSGGTGGFYPGGIAWYRKTLAELLDMLAEGALKPIVAERIPLVEAARAHELLERGGYTGKVVLVTS